MRPTNRPRLSTARVPTVVLALVVSGLSCTYRNVESTSAQSLGTPTGATAGTPAPSTTGSPAGPSPNPRGTRIRLSNLRGRVAFDCGSGVCISNVDGSNVRHLTHLRGPEFDPTWAPDGTRVAYRDSRRGINHNDEIYVVNTDGSRRRNLTRSSSNDWGPDWSSDGRLIAYSSDLQLSVMRPDGTHRQQVTDIEAEYPSWSPDGRRIAFMSAQPDARGSDPNYDVFVVNRNGSGLHQLTDWRGEDGWPAWSPRGTWIAFTTTHDAGGRYVGGSPYRDVYIMRPDGTGKRRVVTSITGAMPVWSLDGRTIMFTGSHLSRPGLSYLWVIRPDGSGLLRLPIRGDLADWIGP
jgi:Tol biopolymer transport system component